MSVDDRDDLDRRGRAAAADLRSAAARRPVPAWDPDALPTPTPLPLHPHRGRRVLAAAAVVVALAAVGAAVAARSDRDEGPADEVVTQQPRGWELGAVPAGLELAGAGASVREDQPDAPRTLAAYGEAAEDPQVGVASMPSWSLDEMGATAEQVTVDGTRAADLTDFGLAPVAAVIDDPASPGDGIVAVSATLDLPALVRLLAATSVTDGEARIEASAMPEGWKLLSEDPSGPFVGNVTAMARGGAVDARSVTYLEADAEEGFPRSLTVTARAGDEDQLQLVRLTAEEVEEVEVGGVPALLTAQEIGDPEAWTAQVLRTVTWQPRPGEIVQLTGYGIAAQDLLDAAAGARPVDERAWTELERRSELGLLDQGAGVVIGEGTLEDGTAFALRFDPDTEALDLNVAVDDDGSGWSGSASASSDLTGPRDATRWIASSSTEIAGRVFDAGLVSADVAFVSFRGGDQELARIDVRSLGLDAQDAEALGPDLAAARWYAVERPEGADRLVLILADGTEGPTAPVDGPMITETGPDGSTVTIVEGGG